MSGVITISRENLDASISAAQERGALLALMGLAMLAARRGSAFGERALLAAVDTRKASELARLVAQLDPVDSTTPKPLRLDDVQRVAEALEKATTP